MSKRNHFFGNRTWLSAAVAIVTVGLALIVIWLTTYAGNEEVHFKDLKSYSYHSYGASFLLPDNWVPHSSASNELEFYPDNLSSFETPARIALTRYGEISPDWLGLNEQAKKAVVDSVLSDVGSNAATDDFTAAEIRTINGNYGIYGNTREADSRYKTEMKGLAFVSVGPDGILYKIVAMATPDIYSDNDSGIEQVISSFDYVDSTN